MNYNKNHGFGAMAVQGLPLLGSGKHFFVGDSGTANRTMVNELFGQVDPDGAPRFFATIDAAIGACTASAGDRIIVLPGHSETISAASGIDMDVAGVSLIGIGVGSNRPTISFTTVDSADMDFGADNLYIENIVFINAFDGTDEPLDIEASVDNVTFKNCEFRDDTASMQTDRWIQTAATNTNLKLVDCEHVGSDTAGAVAFITITGGSGHVIDGLVSNGDFSAGNIQLLTTLTGDILIKNCILENANAVDVNIEGNSLSSTGWIVNTMCRLATDGQTTWINNVGGITIYESFGADNSGEAGTKLGTAGSGDIATDVAAILVDTGTTLPATLVTIDANQDAGVADAATNALMRDVVGNKTDAAAAGAVSATESVMAYVKQLVGELQTADAIIDSILVDTAEIGAAGAGLTALATQTSVNTVDANQDVGVADAATNALMRDVVGNKTDAAAAGAVSAVESIMAYAKQLVTELQVADAIIDSILVDTAEIGAAGAGLTALATQASVNVIDDFLDTEMGAADSVTTESLHGKLGTDTELADRSLYDIINGAGPAAAATQASPGNDVSLYAVASRISQVQLTNIVTKTYANLAGYDTAPAFTITGDVMVRVFGTVGATAITSTSGTTTLSIGTTADPDACIPATTIDNSDFAIGDAWTDNNPEDDASAIAASDWVLIAGGADIVLTRNVDDIVGGALSLYCEYRLLSAGSAVTAA